MQKSHPETPKIRRARRTQLPSAFDTTDKHGPDTTFTSTRVGMSHHRATMAPNNFSISENITARRRLAVNSRMSMMPFQEPQDGPKASDVESDDVELGRLYSGYLKITMSMIVINKKTEERKNLLLMQLATIMKECDHDEDKLFNFKKRQKDLINLTNIQNEVDKQIMDVNNCTKSDEIKILKEILSQLSSLLRPLDVLRCNNIILPDTAEEWEETEKTLKDCASTLKSIMELIGDKGEAYKNVYDGIKDFIKTYNEIGDVQQRIKNALCSLQVLVLKTASLSLTPADELCDS